jgi:hypothetical protein
MPAHRLYDTQAWTKILRHTGFMPHRLYATKARTRILCHTGFMQHRLERESYATHAGSMPHRLELKSYAAQALCHTGFIPHRLELESHATQAWTGILCRTGETNDRLPQLGGSENYKNYSSQSGAIMCSHMPRTDDNYNIFYRRATYKHKVKPRTSKAWLIT